MLIFSELDFNMELLFKIEDTEPNFLNVLLHDLFYQIIYFTSISVSKKRTHISAPIKATSSYILSH